MTQLGDYNVKEPAGGSGSWMPAGKPPWPLIGIAVAAVFMVAFAAFWFLGRGGEEPAPPPQAAIEEPPPAPAPPPPPRAPEPEPFELPVLDASDAVVRDLVAALSAHPALAEWLVTDDLIRTFVVVVDNVADGRNPAQHLPVMRPDTRFQTAGEEPEFAIDPRSFARYDAHAQIVASVDTSGAGELFLTLRPLMDEAYRELGYPETPFMDTFQRAVARLLEAPIVEGQPTLLTRVSFFEYTDDTLESLSPVQKQLMGMGPDNMRTVQSKLREIAQAIGIPADSLPRSQVLLR